LGLGLDSDGNVYVADALNYRIQKFTNTGTFLTKWGSQGPAPGQFAGLPTDVAVSVGGMVYVTDYSGKVQVFAPVPTPTKSASWGSIKAGYR
jgi:sugar lactone lactonase YvrE